MQAGHERLLQRPHLLARVLLQGGLSSAEGLIPLSMPLRLPRFQRAAIERFESDVSKTSLFETA